MALNPKSLDVERIVIQCHGKQSERVVFPKYYSNNDYTNLFWPLIFLLEYLETSPYKFQTILLLKRGNFSDVLKRSCLYLTVLGMEIYDLDKGSLELSHEQSLFCCSDGYY